MSRNIDPGGGSYLTAANTGVNFTSAMTISIWAKLDVAQGYLITRATGLTGGTQRFGFGIWIATTSYGFFLGDGGFNASHCSGVVDPRIGQWDHIVARVSGGTGMQLYVNGQLDGVATSSFALTSTIEAITLGGAADHPSGNAMDGQLADIAIWNIDLSPREIFDLYQGRNPEQLRPGNLRAYWRLNGVGGTTEIDRSIFASHATPTASSMAPHPPVLGVQPPEPLLVGQVAAAPNTDAATVYLDIQPSGADIASISDLATVYLDLQPISTVESLHHIDSATVLVDISVLGGECYSRFHFTGEGEADTRWDVSTTETKWLDYDVSTRWGVTIEVQPGCH